MTFNVQLIYFALLTINHCHALTSAGCALYDLLLVTGHLVMCGWLVAQRSLLCAGCCDNVIGGMVFPVTLIGVSDPHQEQIVSCSMLASGLHPETGHRSRTQAGLCSPTASFCSSMYSLMILLQSYLFRKQ